MSTAINRPFFIFLEFGESEWGSLSQIIRKGSTDYANILLKSTFFSLF